MRLTGAVCNILKPQQEYFDDFELNQCHEVRRKIKNNLEKNIIGMNKLLKRSTISLCALEQRFQVNIQIRHERT